MPGGLRTGRDQRRRHAPCPDGRRHSGLQSSRWRRPLRRPEDGLGYRRLRQARGGGGDHPQHSPGLRRAWGQGEPLDREDALPGPGARSGGLPRRACEARFRGAHTRRKGPDEEVQGGSYRGPPPTYGRVSNPPVRLCWPERACWEDEWGAVRGSWEACRGVRGRGPTRYGPEFDLYWRSRGPARRTSGRAPSGPVLPEAWGVRAWRRSLYGERVLSLRHRRDQGQGPGVGPRDGREGWGSRPGDGEDALLGLLGLLRAAPDRGHRLPRRDREDAGCDCGGRGHRSWRLSWQGCCIYRLGRGREAGWGGP